LIDPYYSENGIEIYCGRCEDIVPELDRKFGVLLTDPPYGIGAWSHTGGNSITEAEAKEVNEWDVAPTPETFSMLLGSAKYSIIWGGNYFDLGRFRSPLIWDKGQRGMHFADGELAWTNFDFGTLRIFNLHVAAAGTKGKRYHPTQKPVALMKWSLSFLKPDVLSLGILDSYMGSGSTLRAAKDLGLPARPRRARRLQSITAGRGVARAPAHE
jgi:site-specific DNA-methyltransferase (adenine-specific)